MERTEKIKVHLIHGSIPKINGKSSKRLMGLIGGHALIELRGYVYGFTYRNRSISIIPNNKLPNSIVQKYSKSDWLDETDWEKTTSYELEIKQNKVEHLYNLLNQYVVLCPFDYAVFGKRCCSFNYKILSKVGIVKQSLKADIINFFPILYIKLFCKLLTPNISISSIHVKDGTKSRIWI